MEKHVAIVTGASSDIGLAIVQGLLEAEYRVIAQAHSTTEKLGLLSQKFLDLTVIKWDLSTSDAAQDFIKSIESTSQIHVLINTIGPLLHKELSELTPKEWADQIHLNLNLAYYLSYYAKHRLIESQGHIVNFTFAGVELLKARVEATPYCAAKAGLVILTKSLAHIFASAGVRVNAISPGLVESSPVLDESRKKMAEEIPFGRPGTPLEIVDLLKWLLTKSPKYLTGALIPLAGAWEYL